jgi:hypothetical protein
LKVGEEEEEERQCCNVGPPSPPHPAFILLVGLYAKKERWQQKQELGGKAKGLVFVI